MSNNRIDCPKCEAVLFDGTRWTAVSKMHYDFEMLYSRVLVRCARCGLEAQHAAPLPEDSVEPEASEAPDYTAPIFGVRQWSVSKDRILGGTGVGGEWAVGETMKARCKYLGVSSDFTGLRGELHKSPEENCGCGLYAFYGLGEAERYGDRPSGSLVRGVVSSWGDVVQCEHGVRAEYMKVEALLLEQQTVRVLGSPVSVVAAHRRLAEKHGVPLILPGEIDSFAREKGLVRLKPEKLPAPTESVYLWGSPSWGLGRYHLPPPILGHHRSIVHGAFALPPDPPPPTTYKGWRSKVKKLFGKEG